MLTFVIFATLLVSGYAQRIVPGSCPNIPTEESFDAVKFLGNWVETEKTPSIFDFVLRCLEVVYKQEKGGSLNVNLHGVSLGGLPISITGDGVIHDSNRNGVFNVRYVFGVPFQGTLMTVVDTDYKEYAVLYSCTNSILPRVFHTEYVWILTRDGTLSNPSRQNIYTKLDSLKINRNQMQLSDRLGCPARNVSTPAREEVQPSPIVAAPLANYVKTPIKQSIASNPSAPQTIIPGQTQSTFNTVPAKNSNQPVASIESIASIVSSAEKPSEEHISKDENLTISNNISLK